MSRLPSIDGPRTVIELGSPLYPELLAATDNPPDQLYVIGDPTALQPGIAIVGARKATPYGIDCSRLFGACAAAQGVTVVSGGAIGCDQAAQEAALDAGGKVVCVLGTGADVAYPAGGAPLFARTVACGGAVVSQRPWGSEPARWAFVQRNAVIAGLAQATLVIEAGVASGTFSTADAALAAGRTVLAVPGSIFSPESMGSNRLIHQGAVPVHDEEAFAMAVDSCFGFALASAEGGAPDPAAGLEGTDLLIVRALAANPTRPEPLAAALGMEVTPLMRALASLEVAGRVERHRDGRYCATVPARIAAASTAAR